MVPNCNSKTGALALRQGRRRQEAPRATGAQGTCGSGGPVAQGDLLHPPSAFHFATPGPERSLLLAPQELGCLARNPTIKAPLFRVTHCLLEEPLRR